MRFVFTLLALAAAGCLDFDQFVAGDGGSGGDLARGDGGAIDLASRDAREDRDMPNRGDGFGCQPGAFLGCMNQYAQYCGDTGQTVLVDCGAQCRGPSDCGLCTPGSATCMNATLVPCTSMGAFGAPTLCPTLGGQPACLDATQCAQCSGGQVCGDGMVGTKDVLYQCSNGMIHNPMPCPFGCDRTVNACADLVPANQAAENSPSGFSCTGMGTMLPPLKAGDTQTLTINTDAKTVLLNGQAQPFDFGTEYKNTANNANLVVMHVGAIDLTAGATFQVDGANALVILVDGSVSLGTGGGKTTLINLTGGRGNAGNVPAEVGDGVAGLQYTGGGGAGHGTMGSPGGSGNLGGMIVGGAGGVPYGVTVPFLLEPGAHGGAGAPSGSGTTNTGGFGGGALQISSCAQISVDAGVIVNASGAGGAGGPSDPNQAICGGGGAGGGSGGTVVLEAAAFSIAGKLVANGGGGGAGGAVASVGGPGTTWNGQLQVTTPAPGGTGAKSNNGGGGGVRGALPGKGLPGPLGYGGGGGGGAVGKITIASSPAFAPPVLDLNLFSPAPTVANVCVTVAGLPPMNCP